MRGRELPWTSPGARRRGSAGAPLLRGVRARLAALMAREGERDRSLVVIGADGVALADARRLWRGARISAMSAELPTTSSTGWLSSLSGLAPVEHGALGVVQRGEADRVARFVLSPDPDLALPPVATAFADATRLGRRAIALTGDLLDLDGPWRARLLAGAEIREGPRLLAGRAVERPEPGDLVESLESALERALDEAAPAFVWCHVDIDLAIHHHGVDPWVEDLLVRLDAAAGRLARRARVVAYADHGLVPTRHDPELAARLAAFCEREGLAVGGAGRMRWLYDAHDPRIERALRALLPEDVRLVRRAALFPAGPYRARVGPLVLLATGTRFLTDPLYTHDHGAGSPAERRVPFAVWEAR